MLNILTIIAIAFPPFIAAIVIVNMAFQLLVMVYSQRWLTLFVFPTREAAQDYTLNYIERVVAKNPCIKVTHDIKYNVEAKDIIAILKGETPNPCHCFVFRMDTLEQRIIVNGIKTHLVSMGILFGAYHDINFNYVWYLGDSFQYSKRGSTTYYQLRDQIDDEVILLTRHGCTDIKRFI